MENIADRLDYWRKKQKRSDILMQKIINCAFEGKYLKS